MPSEIGEKELKMMAQAVELHKSYNTELKKVDSNLSLQKSKYKALAKEEKVFEASLKAMSSQHVSAIGKMTHLSGEQIKSVKKLVKEFKNKEVTVSAVRSRLSGLRKEMKGTESNMSALAQESIRSFNAIENAITDASKGGFKNFRDNFQKIRDEIEETTHESEKFKEGYDEKLNLEAFKNMRGSSVAKAGETFQKAKLDKSEAKNFAESGISGAKEAFGALLSGDLGTVFKKGGDFSAYVKAASATGKATSKLTGTMELFGVALKGLGKIGIIMMIIQAVVKLVKTMSDLDKFLKGLNRSFIEIAGPMQQVGDAAEEMKKFNRAIYDVSRNIKLGLQPEKVREMFGAMEGSGVSMRGLMQRVGDYGKTIESARKSSLSFGVAFDKMGGMMADQMLELRASLKDIEDGFERMSFDADRAGISSNKFYQAVEQATTSLGFYGNFIESTSDKLADLTGTGRLGFGEASKQIQDMNNALSSMGTVGRMKVVNLLGEKEVRGMFKGVSKDFKRDLIDNENEIVKIREKLQEDLTSKEKEGLYKNLDALNKERKKIEGMLADAEIGATGTLDQMASMLPMLSDRMSSMVVKLFGKDKDWKDALLKGGIAFQKIMSDVFGLSEQASIQFHSNLRAGADQLMRASKSYSELDPLGEDSKKVVEDAADALTDGTANAVDKLRSTLKSEYKGQKGLDNFIKRITDIATQYPDLARNILKGQENFRDMDKALMAMAEKEISNPLAMTRKMEEDKLNSLIEEITPMADYIDIGKKGLKLAIAEKNHELFIRTAMTKIAKDVGGIAGKMLKEKRQEEKRTVLDLKKDGIEQDLREAVQLERHGILTDNKALENRAGKSKESFIREYKAAGVGVDAIQEIIDSAITEYTAGRNSEGFNKKMDELVKERQRQIQSFMLLGRKYAKEFEPDEVREMIKERKIEGDTWNSPQLKNKHFKGKERELLDGVLKDAIFRGMKSAYEITRLMPKKKDGRLAFSGDINLNFNAPVDVQTAEFVKKKVKEGMKQVVDEQMYAYESRWG